MVLDTLLFTLAVYPYHINDAWCGFRCWMKTLILTRSHSHYTFNENSCIYLFQWEQFHPKNIILCIIYSSSHKCFKNLMGEWRVENLLIRTISIVIFFYFIRKCSLYFLVHLQNTYKGVKFKRHDVKAFCSLFTSISFPIIIGICVFGCLSICFLYLWFDVNFRLESFESSFTVLNL